MFEDRPSPRSGPRRRPATAHLDVADPPACAAGPHSLRAGRQPPVPAASSRALRAGLHQGRIRLVLDLPSAIGQAAFRLVASIGLACYKECDPNIRSAELAEQRTCPRTEIGERSHRNVRTPTTILAARGIET